MHYIMYSHTPLGEDTAQLNRTDGRYEAWLTGARFPDSDQPPRPLRLQYDPRAEGSFVCELYQAPAVLMSTRLVQVLKAAGADNMDIYPVTITNTATNETYDTHVAVNIIGTVKAADLGRSEFDERVPERLMSAAFDKLVIDDGAVCGLLLFRLAENLGAIVVHESVADRVRAEGWDTIRFMEPEEWFSA